MKIVINYLLKMILLDGGGGEEGCHQPLNPWNLLTMIKSINLWQFKETGAFEDGTNIASWLMPKVMFIKSI